MPLPPDDDGQRAREEAIRDEQGRARRLRLLVDIAASVLMQGRLSRPEAEDVVAHTRQRALELFPGKEGVFDLVLAPRFARLVEEFAVQAPAPRILPFRRRN